MPKPAAKKTVSTRRRKKDPLNLKLTVAVRFGEEEEDRVVLLDDREVVMVGSIFRYRDKMARFLVTGLLRAALLQPRVAAKILPGLKSRLANHREE